MSAMRQVKWQRMVAWALVGVLMAMLWADSRVGEEMGEAKADRFAEVAGGFRIMVVLSTVRMQRYE
jgi:hypothetical protein